MRSNSTKIFKLFLNSQFISISLKKKSSVSNNFDRFVDSAFHMRSEQKAKRNGQASFISVEKESTSIGTRRHNSTGRVAF
jgi:hypothetical protein